MTDYISRKDLLDKLDAYEPGEDFEYEHELWSDIRLAIIHEPAADVREVVRAKWERIPLNMSPEYFAYKWNLRKKCTACSYAMPDEYPNYNICPNCGAVMGGQDSADD